MFAVARRPFLAFTTGIVLLAGGAGLGCAEMKQNLRGQELSFRGTYFCERDGCKAGEMVRSTQSTLEGATTISTVKLQPRATLLFTAAAPFDTLLATVTDCKGKRAQVDARDIAKPGKHGVGDAHAKESWAISVDKKALAGLELAKKGDCAVWMVQASATWSDGATYSLKSGLRAQR